MGVLGPPNIEKLRKKKKVEKLIRLLESLEDGTRMKAAKALVIIGKPAVEPLINALIDEGYKIRARKKYLGQMYIDVPKIASELLVMIGEPAVGSLIQALQDESSNVRERAARVLGEIGDKRAVEPIIQALKDSSKCYWVLLTGIASKALVKMGRPAVKPLVWAMKDEDRIVRENVAEILGDIGDQSAVEPLIQVALNDYGDAKRRAIVALGSIRDKRAVEPLIQVLRDLRGFWSLELEDLEYAIVRLGKPAVEPLIQILNHKRWYVRYCVANALGRICDARVIEPLIQASKDKHWLSKFPVEAGNPVKKALDELDMTFKWKNH